MPGLDQPAECRVVDVAEIEPPDLCAERCTGRDHVECARGATGLRDGLCGSWSWFSPAFGLPLKLACAAARRPIVIAL